MMSGQPVLILKEGSQRETGKTALHNNIKAATVIADAVRTTLGPYGMDKLLVDSLGDVTVTNDGATILKELEVEHPAAKMIVEVAKTQDSEVGDGTTTSVVLAGELLRRAEELVEKNVHPTVITSGYSKAAEKAREFLSQIAVNIDPSDKRMLANVAETALSGKNIGGANDYIADLAVRSVLAVAEDVNGEKRADIKRIKVEKKHGADVRSSELIEGVLIDKERAHPRMPELVEKAKVALITQALEIKKTEISSSIEIRDPTKIQAFMDEEEKEQKEMADRIIASGANVVICEKGISDVVQHYLARNGIYAVQRAKKSDMEALARATGGRLVANIRELSKSDLGEAGLVEERKVSSDAMTFVTKCRHPKSVSVLLRGGTEQSVNDYERAFNDAIHVVALVVEDGKVVPGGGAAEIEISMRLRKYSAEIGGREQLAVDAYATSLEYIPRTLAENAGKDPVDTLIDLKSRHSKEAGRYDGISSDDGKIKDMVKAKVLEPLRVKRQAIASATEVASMILRIDDVVAAKRPTDEEKKGPGGQSGMPGMPPGM
ncbi:MAG: thermosome subunit beta [Methanomassiliicoccales archaeon]